MGFASWKAFYQSDLQAVWAVTLVPAVFLAVRALRLAPGRSRSPGVVPSRAGFVDAWALLFALETIADAVATGPLVRALGWNDSSAGLALVIGFVLLGDFRVFWLIFALAAPERPLGAVALRAAGWTLVVPVVALALNRVLHAMVSDLPDQTIWLVYELGFLCMALALRLHWIPRNALGPGGAGLDGQRWLRRVASYVALYYALWAFCDVLILFGGVDGAWLLRALPNQLYYALFVPFVWLSFFARR